MRQCNKLSPHCCPNLIWIFSENRNVAEKSFQVEQQTEILVRKCNNLGEEVSNGQLRWRRVWRHCRRCVVHQRQQRKRRDATKPQRSAAKLLRFADDDVDDDFDDTSRRLYRSARSDSEPFVRPEVGFEQSPDWCFYQRPETCGPYQLGRPGKIFRPDGPEW